MEGLKRGAPHGTLPASASQTSYRSREEEAGSPSITAPGGPSNSVILLAGLVR